MITLPPDIEQDRDAAATQPVLPRVAARREVPTTYYDSRAPQQDDSCTELIMSLALLAVVVAVVLVVLYVLLHAWLG